MSSWVDSVTSSGSAMAGVRSAADPLIALLTFVALEIAAGAQHGNAELLVVLLTCLLMYPGRIPFRSFSLQAALKILLNWSWVILLLLSVGLSRTHAAFEVAPWLELNVISLWALLAPAALIAVHTVSPRVVPYLRSVYKPRKVIIVGVTELALRVAGVIESGEAEGQRMLGYFDDRSMCRLANRRPPAVLGRLDELADYVKRNHVDIIYICLPMTSQPRILDLLEQLRDTTASIYFIPDIFIADLIHARVDVIGGVPVVSICESPLQGLPAVLKRSVDLTLALALLPLALPLMVAIGIVIRATSAGPALFTQKRYGLDGREIMVWKFRTMKALEDGDKVYRQVTRDDDRVTAVGRILRKTSLDELPQLMNVIAGTMSLVGPRPHALAVNEQYRRMIPGYMVRHKVKPGITGWAQVHGHRGGDDLESMRKRTEFDLEYLRSWSVMLDLLIIFKTALMLLKGDSKAY
jgi:putative colanic acid biosysnthesis UDP-glucose lipid carrier transferase